MPSIFVTVGSTQFDSLIAVVAEQAFLRTAKRAGYDAILIQYGQGVPPVGCSPEQATVIAGLSARVLSFSAEVELEVEKCDLVISHAGSASILSALRAGKKLIVVPNTTLADNHQLELAEELERGGYLAVATPESLPETLLSLPLRTFQPFPPFRPERFRAIMDEQMGYSAYA